MQWDKRIIKFKCVVEQAVGRTKFGSNNPMQKDVKRWKDIVQLANNEDQELVFPVVLYLSSSRLWNENRNFGSLSLPDRTDGYKNCLDKKHGTQLVFDYIKTIRNIASEEDGDIALMKKDKTVLQFESLSDGYRNVIKIILDIAVRMCILNPYLKENVLELTPGVVIIDEIDLSLHPTWQRRIVGILKGIFPKVQFICATHSPFIIQSLEPGELISLENTIEDEYAGNSIEDIAEDIMGVQVPQYSEKKIRMYKAAEDYFAAVKRTTDPKKLEELKSKVDILAAEYSDNPAYLALIRQKYYEKLAEMENNNETSE